MQVLLKVGGRRLLTFRSKGGSQDAMFSGDMRADFKRFSNAQPENFIYPYLSERRSIGFSDQIKLENSNNVTGTHYHLYSKIDRVYSSPSLRPTYEEACQSVLGIVPTPFPSEQGKKAGLEVDARRQHYISLSEMGAGVANAVGLIVELVIAQRKLFLIEELENDLHPAALRSLLKLIERSAKEGNQFVISTHSNIVLRALGSTDDAKVFEVKRKPTAETPESTVSEVPSNSDERLRVLRSLGYELGDLEVYEAWLILEESSAERIIRDFLVPWFAKGLLGRIRTLAAQGANDVEPRFSDLHRTMVFASLQPIYQGRAWVLVDGDKAGKEATSKLKEKFADWPAEHFQNLAENCFEKYYPSRFSNKVNECLSIADKETRREKKKSLLNEVMNWLRTSEEARSELSDSAREVIEVLKNIEARLIGTSQEV